MARERFISKQFRADALRTITDALDIIQEYQRQGYSLTLRQLYYQFVARGLIANKQAQYNRLGRIISDARLAGYIDWDAIVDRTRNVERNSHWSSPADIIDICANTFRYDLWADQDTIVEVWIEKQALIGVIEQICEQLDVPYLACRGYVSQSELWRAGVRSRNRNTVILHLGDHDPSGMDMTRDNQDRLYTFSLGANVCVERIALNWDQIEQYEPPPNPAKLTDTRAEGYIQEFGYSSWELDALDPVVIRDLIETHVNQYIDRDRMDRKIEEQQEARNQLTLLSSNWDEVIDFLEGAE